MHSCRQVDDPIEIIKRLMIGSEGTLGFVSRATYNTVPEWPHKVTRTAAHVNQQLEQGLAVARELVSGLTKLRVSATHLTLRKIAA